MIIMTMTMRISNRVKPASPASCTPRSHGGRDILILALAAFMVVSAKREDDERAAGSRLAIGIGIAPWIGRHLVLLQVGAAPVPHLGGRCNQRLEAFALG